MRIEILHRTSIAGSVQLPGAVLEVANQDGRYLIAVGKARLAEDPILPVVVSEPEAAPKPSATPRKPRTRKGI